MDDHKIDKLCFLGLENLSFTWCFYAQVKLMIILLNFERGAVMATQLSSLLFLSATVKLRLMEKNFWKKCLLNFMDFGFLVLVVAFL